MTASLPGLVVSIAMKGQRKKKKPEHRAVIWLHCACAPVSSSTGAGLPSGEKLKYDYDGAASVKNYLKTALFVLFSLTNHK